VTVDTPPAPGPAPAAPAAPLPAPVSILYNSQSGVLLRDNNPPNMVDWRIVPHRAVIHSAERVVCVEPFEAVLEIGDNLCELVLLEGTSVAMMPPTPNWLFGLDIRQGKLILKAQPSAAVEGKPVAAPPAIGLKVDNDIWRFQLATPDTICGIQVQRRQPEQLEKLPEPRPYSLTMAVTAGSVRIDDGKGHASDVGMGNLAVFVPLAADAANGNPLLPIEPLMVAPAWMSDEARQMLPAALRYAKLFEQEFRLDQPLKDYIPTVVRNPTPRLSALAVKTLAVTENAPLLIETLAQKDQHEESRVAAIDGLRNWLTFSPENGKRLPELLKKSFHDDEVLIVNRLLWGFNKEDGMNLETANQLIDMMDNDSGAIRELAFQNVFRLTNKRLEYRSSLPPQTRSLAINRWRREVDRAKGLVRK
jgi:hypothetical protein